MINPYDIELVNTCGACPEQYDAFYKGDKVGYLRLRHGCFRVDYPHCGGETIYKAHPKGDGLFESEERERYLNEAKLAIYNRLVCDENKKDKNHDHYSGNASTHT